MILYKTKWGIKLINYLGTKYKRTIKVLSYVSIFLGYILMIMMTYLIIDSVYLYFTTAIAETIRAPPVAPLIPYFPQIFGLQSFFPPFYFTYFIISILIVATVHEFSHGVFARRYGIKIKSTGFAFLKYFPAILGAFVEQDDKQMNKKSKFEQMSVLSAGVFANIFTAALFFIILIIYFSVAFSPSGVIFDSYATSAITVSGISMINSVPLHNASYEKILNLSDEEGFNNMTFNNKTYLSTKAILESQKDNSGRILVYNNAPAIRANLSRIITEMNGVKINSLDKLKGELEKYNPGDNITITEKTDTGFSDKKITLEENPGKPGVAWLGIGFFEKSGKGLKKIIYVVIFSFKNPNIYYQNNWELSQFFYNLIWWIVIINLLVGLFNMLPLGILDGGRFFYLTIFGITKSEKISEKAFKWTTWFILLLFLILMLKWVFVIFF